MTTNAKVRALRRVLRQVDLQLGYHYDDPISSYYGVTPPPPRWPQQRIAAALLQLRLSRADAVAALSDILKREPPSPMGDPPSAWYELILLEDC
jgi:hypothetical protein